MKQRITLKIAGRESQLMIDSEKEEVIRAAAERINSEIDELRFNYGDKDLCDILSIILLSEEKRLIEMETDSNRQNTHMMERLDELDETLGEYLSRQHAQCQNQH